ncbi:hypothetical protein BO94DRAFT_606328 [Aspergillus sclerotioniger CBS 115572]|uniref:Uncharacterized protein n=1 Tax=Aspergillus sclerotioniger CBS 115572 TaxID=1450535 RepID=A0A317X9C2_9EURO|nr:hypothetical protein BO94DRAFT_606328 [Aspergillus sclerotioniger CBS 115572]PWY95166.1 hypothetical protein BO94DRAFT_606328 [Aspergillus sclerotioniger CBS 115572]
MSSSTCPPHEPLLLKRQIIPDHSPQDSKKARVKSAFHSNPVPCLQQGSLFRLPQEVLELIITFAAPYFIETCGGREYYFSYRTVADLALVCRRLYWIATPILYRSISLQLIDTWRLHHTLQANPTLRQYCRILFLEASVILTTPGDNVNIVQDIVSWLTSVKKLHIYCSYHYAEDDHVDYVGSLCDTLANATQNMHELDSLECIGVGFNWVMGAVQSSSLNALTIRSGRRIKKTLKLHPKKSQDSSVTNLSLDGCLEAPDVMAQLLQWPKALSSFHLTCFNVNDDSVKYSFSMFETWLRKHETTLQTLTLCGLPSDNASECAFNASAFPQLGSLRLSRWNMGTKLWLSDTDADKLLGPSLKTFTWDFRKLTDQKGAWKDFREEEENWLRKFARAAVEKRAALKSIRIAFSPYDSGQGTVGYPWGRMARVRDEFEPYGVIVTWDAPVLEGDDWPGASPQYVYAVDELWELVSDDCPSPGEMETLLQDDCTL